MRNKPVARKNYLSPVVFIFLTAFSTGCAGSRKEPAESKMSRANENMTSMTVEELMQEPKIDAHAHFMALTVEDEEKFIAKLNEHNMTWLTICTVGTDWANLQKQIGLAEHLHADYPKRVGWAVSFNLENWGSPKWQQQAIATIASGVKKGALAVKVWKDFGMLLKDTDGNFVMVDDPRLTPVFNYLESRGLTLAAHIGEPYNCWLPVDSMTNERSVEYYSEHPQYHGYLHPEVPGYWEQIASRDSLLARHPGLRVVGAHLGSLEWNLEELAARFECYPNFAVDMAERIYNLQEHDRDQVRDFIITYQDRLLYGTDLVSGWGDKGVEGDLEKLEHTYLSDYRYFATDEQVKVHWISPTTMVRGLALPASVLKKIFYGNARKWYPGL
ncbi:amidohydrolase family protein [Gemmatimonadota bacterium]